MPKKNAKSKRSDAERAAEWFAYECLGCVIARRAVRTKWQKQDFFGADVMGKLSTGNVMYVQVTAGQTNKVLERRKKMEKIPWHPNESVYVIQLVQTEDPANPRRKLWWFRVWWYDHHNGKWYQEAKVVPVPEHWFKAYKNKK